MRALLQMAVVASLCMVLQTTLLRAFFGPAAPDLLLALCVYLGLHRHTVGGALGAFVLGYLEDSFSAGIAGLNAFGMCLVFSFVYLTSRRLWVDNMVSKVVVVFLAVVVKTVAVSILLALFLSIEEVRSVRPITLVTQASLTALFAPALFSLLTRRARSDDGEAR